MDKTTCPLWMLIAHSQHGIKEIQGSRYNAEIMNMFRIAGAEWPEDDAVPWCAAYVGSCLERAGIVGTRSLLARSYLEWGNECSAKVGAVVVFPRGNNPKQGHVGFVYLIEGDDLYVLGGNQSNAVTVQKRKISEALGFRWPHMEASYTEAFEEAMRAVREWEGGWYNHPADPGGATMKGITIGRYKEWKQRSVTPEELREISDDEVQRIYFHSYWSKVWCDQMPAGIALMHFDCAVNQGPGRARKFLQSALSTSVDGSIGPITLKKARAAHQPTVVNNYYAVREKHYKSLRGTRNGKAHFKGWMNRLRSIKNYALGVDVVPSPRPETPKVDSTDVVVAVGGAAASWYAGWEMIAIGIGVLIVGYVIGRMIHAR